MNFSIIIFWLTIFMLGKNSLAIDAIPTKDKKTIIQSSENKFSKNYRYRIFLINQMPLSSTAKSLLVKLMRMSTQENREMFTKYVLEHYRNDSENFLTSDPEALFIYDENYNQLEKEEYRNLKLDEFFTLTYGHFATAIHLGFGDEPSVKLKMNISNNNIVAFEGMEEIASYFGPDCLPKACKHIADAFKKLLPDEDHWIAGVNQQREMIALNGMLYELSKISPMI